MALYLYVHSLMNAYIINLLVLDRYILLLFCWKGHLDFFLALLISYYQGIKKPNVQVLFS